MGFEVSQQAHAAGQAEGAVQGTAHLGREAQRQSILLRDEHAFDGFAVLQLEDEFLRAVLRRQDFRVGESADARLRGQLHADRLRQVGHGVEIRGTTLVQPAEDLVGMKAGPALVPYEIGCFIGAQGREINCGHHRQSVT